MAENKKTLKYPQWIAIAGWALIALVFLVYFIIALRLDYVQMLVPCQGANCYFAALSPAEVAVLTSWGLSTHVYANFMILIPIFVSVVYWALGALIVWRQGNTVIGWAVSLALIVIPISTYVGSTDWAANYPNLVIPGIVLNFFGTVIMIVFFYLIPNGRFSPRWAYIPFTITIILISLLILQINGILALSGTVQSILGTTIVGLVILGGSFQIYRYRREATLLERQQIKWILFGVLTYVFGIILWVLVYGGALEIPAGQTRLLAMFVETFTNLFTLLFLPVAITIAILRYRLWDIDLVIRRTLQYGTLTALLALLYLGGVVILQWVLGSLTGDFNTPIVTVMTTLGIAALFNPLRSRVQEFFDRRFYRKKYNAEQALAQFSATARDEVDMDKLIAALHHVIQDTVQPEQVSLWQIMQDKKQ